MRVAVFGATGRTGALVVRCLLDHGHEVVDISRRMPSVVHQGSYESVVGDVTDSKFLAPVLRRCQGVIFCVGQNLKNPRNFFSQSLSPTDIRTQIVRSIMHVIGMDRSKRIVYLSAFGVGNDIRKTALFFRIVLRLSSLGKSYEDHDQAETLIRASDTSWTIVRSPGLTDRDAAVPLVDARGTWSSFSTVSRRSVALFLVDSLEEDRFDRRTITVIKANSRMQRREDRDARDE